MTRTRRTFFLAAALLGGLSSGCAQSISPPPAPLDWQLIDRASGQALPRHWHRGRGYSAGEPGARYAIRLHNRGGERLLVVLSVDGVNVVSGETAAWNQTGYVLDPGQVADIAGWRKSDSQVAAFEFAALRDSYAARTGRPDHVGVIGVAVFQEALPEPPPLPAPQVNAAPAAEAAARDQLSSQAAAKSADATAEARAERRERLGTAHGPREWSPVSRTAFERRSAQPTWVQQLWYDSRANLVAQGVLPRPPVAQLQPNAFPASPGYVPDPPARGW
ncbi:hypothetical protein [Inhella sp.]|uniref:hypothetical protein n=1 Tax=Inhella sp. TaxID=1921806 RepID=UPI0035B38BDE